jgi:hypothetical protein
MPVVVLVLLAGCSQPSDPALTAPSPTWAPSPIFEPDGTPPVMPAPNGSSTETFHASGLIPAGTSEFHAQAFAYPVHQNATAIYLELAWNDTRQDLDAYTEAPMAYCSEADGLLLPFCTLGTYFCADFRVHAFTDCDGDLLSPDNPSRLVVRGDDIAGALAECDDPCMWEAYPTSKVMPEVAIEWHLNITVYYGLNPWDVAANWTQLYAIDAHTTTSESEGRSIVFTTDDNITAALIELAWTDQLGQDLDVNFGVWVGECTDPAGCLQEPSHWRTWGNFSGDYGRPDSPARILVQGSELQDAISACVKPCYWWAGPSSKSPTWAEVDWHLRVTVFRTPVPPGYSALPA